MAIKICMKLQLLLSFTIIARLSKALHGLDLQILRTNSLDSLVKSEIYIFLKKTAKQFTPKRNILFAFCIFIFITCYLFFYYHPISF